MSGPSTAAKEEDIVQLVRGWFGRQDKGADGRHNGRTEEEWIAEGLARWRSRQATAGGGGGAAANDSLPQPQRGVGTAGAAAEIKLELPTAPIHPHWQIGGSFSVKLKGDLKALAAPGASSTTRTFTIKAKDGKVESATKTNIGIEIGEIGGLKATLKFEREDKDGGGTKWKASLQMAGDGWAGEVGAKSDPEKLFSIKGSLVTKEEFTLPIPGAPKVVAGVELSFELTLGLTVEGQATYSLLLANIVRGLVAAAGPAAIAGGLSLGALIGVLYMIGEAGRRGTEIGLVGGRFGAGYANSVAQAYQSALSRESQVWREGDAKATLEEALRLRTGPAHELAEQAGNMAAATDLKPLADDPAALVGAIRKEWAISEGTSPQDLAKLIRDDVLNRVNAALPPTSR